MTGRCQAAGLKGNCCPNEEHAAWHGKEWRAGVVPWGALVGRSVGWVVVWVAGWMDGWKDE